MVLTVSSLSKQLHLFIYIKAFRNGKPLLFFVLMVDRYHVVSLFRYNDHPLLLTHVSVNLVDRTSCRVQCHVGDVALEE